MINLYKNNVHRTPGYEQKTMCIAHLVINEEQCAQHTWLETKNSVLMIAHMVMDKGQCALHTWLWTKKSVQCTLGYKQRTTWF